MSEQVSVKENRMGTERVWSLLLKMAIPVILSTAVQSLYNIVDGIFVSRLGEDALAAISFSSPLVTVIIAIGTGVAVGVNTLVSRALGEKNEEKANKAVTTAIWLVVVVGIIAFLLSRLIARPYLAFMTESENVRELGLSYTHIYMGLSIATVSQLVFERLLISTGKTKYSMISQLTGGLLNTVLDPILIFGLLGFPAMGIMGAAVATVFSQAVATVIAIILNIKKNREIKLSFQLLPDGKTLKEMLHLGIPTAIIQSLGSIMMINFNAVLNQFSTTAVAVFAVCTRVTALCYAVLNALCSATIPIISYNFGAKNKKRIDQTIKYGYLYAIIMMILGTAVCCGLPVPILRAFNATDEMISVGVWGIRSLTCLYVLVAVRNMSNCILQALGKSVTAMLCDFSRNYVVLIPGAWLLSLTGVLNNVWLSIPLADLVSGIVGFTLMRHAYEQRSKSRRSSEAGRTGPL